MYFSSLSRSFFIQMRIIDGHFMRKKKLSQLWILNIVSSISSTLIRSTIFKISRNSISCNEEPLQHFVTDQIGYSTSVLGFCFKGEWVECKTFMKCSLIVRNTEVLQGKAKQLGRFELQLREISVCVCVWETDREEKKSSMGGLGCVWLD